MAANVAPGRSAVKALMTPAFAKLKKAPKITTEEEAHQLLATINTFAFYLRVERGQSTSASSPRPLQINPQQMFQQSDYYAWFYEGSQWTTYIGGIAMVAIMLAGVMFPLWPPIMRLGVWYLSIGVLGLIGLFFAIAIVRLIFYIITVIVASPGIWIFPKLFADVGFVSNFSDPSRVTSHILFTGGIIHSAMGMGSSKEERQEETQREIRKTVQVQVQIESHFLSHLEC